jgi:hypothetical protein
MTANGGIGKDQSIPLDGDDRASIAQVLDFDVDEPRIARDL